MNKKQNALMVIVAHPDDEVLGCGATVHKLTQQGWRASLVILSAGVAGRFTIDELSQDIKNQQKTLAEQTQRAAEELGFSHVDTFDFADNRMDTVSRMDLSHCLRPLIEREQPNMVFTHHPGDYNWDHTRVFDAVMMAARCNPPEFSPAEIRTFEVLSSTERAWQTAGRMFCPNVYVDVSGSVEAKKRAMRHYESEYRPYPHPRSDEGIEYQSRFRGLQVGLEFAEAFHVIRRVEK